MAQVRRELLGPGGAKLLPKDDTEVFPACVRCRKEGPEPGFERLTGLFRELPPEEVTNARRTDPYFPRSHLTPTEEAVTAPCRMSREKALR